MGPLSRRPDEAMGRVGRTPTTPLSTRRRRKKNAGGMLPHDKEDGDPPPFHFLLLLWLLYAYVFDVSRLGVSDFRLLLQPPAAACHMVGMPRSLFAARLFDDVAAVARPSRGQCGTPLTPPWNVSRPPPPLLFPLSACLRWAKSSPPPPPSLVQ